MVGEPGKPTGLRFVNPENKPAVFEENIVKFPREAWGVDVGAVLHRTTINLLVFVFCFVCIYFLNFSSSLALVAFSSIHLITNTIF